MTAHTQHTRYACIRRPQIALYSSSESGLTLLEILISVALLAMLSMSTIGLLTRTQTSRELIELNHDRYHGARVVLDRLARELSMAYISIPSAAVVDQSRLPLTPFVGKDESPAASVMFASFGHVRIVRNARESDQAIIHYYGKPNPKNSKYAMLFRRTRFHYDARPERGGVAYVMLERVAKLEIKYWDKRRQDWVSTWDTRRSENLNILPPLVQILLTVADEKGNETTFLTRTRIPMTQPLKRQ